MKILFCGSVLFLCAFFLHLAIWRVRLPKRQTTAIMAIFLVVLIAGLLVLSSRLQLAAVEYLHISLFFISLTLVYLTTYSALEADSPTLLMIMDIDRAGKQGLEKEKLKNTMNNGLLIQPRINDLVGDKLVYLNQDKYRLTSAGIFFANIFIFYRKLLRSGKGG